MADGMFNWIESDPDLAKLGLVLFQLAPQIKKLDKFMRQARMAGRDRIRNILLSDSNLSALKSEQLENIVTTLHSHMYGFFFYYIVMDKSAFINETKKNCLEGLHMILQNYLSSKFSP